MHKNREKLLHFRQTNEIIPTFAIGFGAPSPLLIEALCLSCNWKPENLSISAREHDSLRVMRGLLSFLICANRFSQDLQLRCGIQFHASFVSFNRGNMDAPVLWELEAECNFMKKIWIFLLGILSGIVLTFLFSLIINRSRNAGITFFDEPGEIVTVECIGKTTPVKCFKIFQTLGEEAGLAYGDEFCARDFLSST